MSETDRGMSCAEYVLGTLPAEERAALERDMSDDGSLRDEVLRWEDWLAGLNEVIPEVAPPPGLWALIEQRLRPTVAAAPRPANDVRAVMRSRARWRTATLAFGALAAGLALFVAREQLQSPAISYLAVVNRGGDLPALIVHVNTGTETVSVRTLSAETPPDRVLELWYIGGGQPPRSLGLLDRAETYAPLPASARTSDLTGATLAVSVEPRGGSTTGAPTGQVVYSGKLIRDR